MSRCVLSGLFLCLFMSSGCETVQKHTVSCLSMPSVPSFSLPGFNKENYSPTVAPHPPAEDTTPRKQNNLPPAPPADLDAVSSQGPARRPIAIPIKNAAIRWSDKAFASLR